MRINRNFQIYKAFTLIELLIAVGIIGIISVVTVNLLFTTVLNRSRQNSIQYGSEDARNFMELISTNVRESTSPVQVNPTLLKTYGTTCRNFRLNTSNFAFEIAEDASGSCNPSLYNRLSDENTTIYAPGGTIPNIFSLNGSEVSIQISGNHKDPFGKHEFSYNTVVTQRIN